MLPLGLSAADQRTFHKMIQNDHMVVPTVQVLDLDQKPVADVSLMVEDGSVNVAHGKDTKISRSCSLTLYDPRGHIGFGTNDPSEGAMFLNNMVRVILSYRSYDIGADLGWVDVPVFTGPVVGMSRDASTISIDALGKEHFALRAAWESKSWHADIVVALIRNVMRQAGETKFDMPTANDLLVMTTEAVDLYPNSHPWWHAQNLAEVLDRQLFYDGRGKLRLRKLPRNPVWVFQDGEQSNIATRPQVSYDVERVRNRVWVKGRNPKGADPRFEGKASLPGNNPFSARALGRGPDNRGGTLLEIIENDHLKSNRECEDKAVEKVNDYLMQSVGIQADVLPVPHLEPGDPVEVDTADINQRTRAWNYSIPLRAGDAMSFGYTRRLVKGRKAKHHVIRPETHGDSDTFTM